MQDPTISAGEDLVKLIEQTRSICFTVLMGFKIPYFRQAGEDLTKLTGDFPSTLDRCSVGHRTFSGLTRLSSLHLFSALPVLGLIAAQTFRQVRESDSDVVAASHPVRKGIRRLPRNTCVPLSHGLAKSLRSKLLFSPVTLKAYNIRTKTAFTIAQLEKPSSLDGQAHSPVVATLPVFLKPL